MRFFFGRYNLCWHLELGRLDIKWWKRPRGRT